MLVGWIAGSRSRFLLEVDGISVDSCVSKAVFGEILLAFGGGNVGTCASPVVFDEIVGVRRIRCRFLYRPSNLR